MIPLVYHPRYNVTAFGLERLHPFDGRKYRRIHDALIARGLATAQGLRAAPPGPLAHDSCEVHTPDYLRSLRSPEVLAGILEVPVVRRLPGWMIDWRILRPDALCHRRDDPGLPAGPGARDRRSTSAAATTMRRPTGAAGSACTPTCRWRPDPARRGEGRPGAGRRPRRPPGQRHGRRVPGLALGLDLRPLRGGPLPGPKEPEDYPLPVGPGLTGSDYLGIVRDTLPGALDAVRPDLVVYNAGSDPFWATRWPGIG